MVGQFCTSGSQWGQKASHGHGSSALNVNKQLKNVNKQLKNVNTQLKNVNKQYLEYRHWRYNTNFDISPKIGRHYDFQNLQIGSEYFDHICDFTKKKFNLDFGNGNYFFFINLTKFWLYRLTTACINSSIKSSYSWPVILLCLSPT